ncbi:MAG: nicotinate (nicotinamide) nucleotide adenylyltransferase [Eubacteriales bacterium]
MEIGIYGGSFNPPHLGHLKVMEAVITQLGLEKLLLVPTNHPPHKTLPLGTPSGAERFAMTDKLADVLGGGREEKKCKVKTLDVELRREGKSYTIETLKILKEQYPEDHFWLIMGEDMLQNFFSWVAPDEIAKLADICAFLRSDQAPSKELKAQATAIQNEFGNEVRLITLPTGIEASSTKIREELSKQRFSPDLLPAVAGRILWKHSYGLKATLVDLDLPLLRSVVWGQVKAKRIPHIKGVEEECVKLARRYEVDENLARRAGILHDVTKYWTHQEHLDFCDQYAYPLTELERENEKLLHAKSGAVFAREILKEPEEICIAIDCHTTGKAKMNKLDQILYLADYIEVNRDFPELETLRRLSYESLDAGMGKGLEISLKEMQERGKETHSDTLEAYAQYG